MRIVVGSGRNDVTRHVFDRPNDKIGREVMAEQLKAFLRARGGLKTKGRK